MKNRGELVQSDCDNAKTDLDRRNLSWTKTGGKSGAVSGRISSKHRICFDRMLRFINPVYCLVSCLLGSGWSVLRRFSLKINKNACGARSALARSSHFIFTTNISSAENIFIAGRKSIWSGSASPAESKGPSGPARKKSKGRRLDMPIVRINDDMYIFPKFYVPVTQKAWIAVESERPVNISILPESSFAEFQNSGDAADLKVLGRNTTYFIQGVVFEWPPKSNFILIISNIRGNNENAVYFRVTDADK